METQTAATPKKKAKAKKRMTRAVALQHAPKFRSAPTSLLQVIAQATLDPRCDVAKMQALLDMQDRLEERDAKKAFTVAFNALQSELPIINKDGKIDHSAEGSSGTTRSGRRALQTSYATYPNLNRVCGPLLKKHGFTFSSSLEPEPSGAMVVISTLEHVAGASRSTRFRITADTTGGKNNQQGWGSAQQYGMRYNMIALLNIVSEAKQDADNDGFAPSDDPGTITKKQAEELAKLLKDAKAPLDKFLAAFSIEALAALPVGDLEMAKSRIATFKRERIRREGDFPGDRVL